MRFAAAFVLTASLMTGATVAADAAEAPSRQTAVVQFTAKHPAASTGLVDVIDYVNPADPAMKPYAVREVKVTLAPGSTIDTSVPAKCTALDPVLILRGSAACPQASRVGGGTVTIDTGVPGPLRFVDTRATLLNNVGQVIFLFESTNLPAMIRFVSRSPVVGGTITTQAPPLPGGPPDLFTAVKTVRVNFDAISVGRGAHRRNYVTTPTTCPASGYWTNQATFTYFDGMRQTVLTNSACH